MKSKDLRRNWGQIAETRAVTWLHPRGFEIMRRNWKVPRSDGQRPIEIDILAKRESTFWIVEVKGARCTRYEIARLLSPTQRGRLYQAAQQLARSGISPVRVALLWAPAALSPASFQWLADP